MCEKSRLGAERTCRIVTNRLPSGNGEKCGQIGQKTSQADEVSIGVKVIWCISQVYVQVCTHLFAPEQTQAIISKSVRSVSV